MMIKNRKIQAGISVVLAVGIGLGSSFAWYNYNQRARNVFARVTEAPIGTPTVNLRDDFDDLGLGKDTGMSLLGTISREGFDKTTGNMVNIENIDIDGNEYKQNKDVYVENSGLLPLYVRVRFEEYLTIKDDLDTNDVDDPTKWTIHGASEESSKDYHEYYEWVLGGDDKDPDNGSKLYLPAPFEKRGLRDSEGEQVQNPDTISYYDATADGYDTGKLFDYNTSALEKNARTEEALFRSTNDDSNKETLAAAHERIEGILNTIYVIDSKEGAVDPSAADGKKTNRERLIELYEALDAAATPEEYIAAQNALDVFLEAKNLGYYDKVYKAKADFIHGDGGDYTFNPSNFEEPEYIFTPIKRTKTTQKVYTMNDWLSQGSPIGDFWVMDTDGWFYWADMLPAGEATGLLLSEVYHLQTNAVGKFDYKINVNLEAATYDDLSKFGTLDGTGTSDYSSAIKNAILREYVYEGNATKAYLYRINGDNTYTLINNDGSHGATYVYTDTLNVVDGYVATGTIASNTNYAVGKTFEKKINEGDEDETTFTVVSPGVVIGYDGARYLKLSYTASSGATTYAWLAVGTNGKFSSSPADNKLVWTTADKPGGGNDSFTEIAVKHKIGDTFKTEEGYLEWVIIGFKEANTVIISKNAPSSSVPLSGISSELARYGDGTGKGNQIQELNGALGGKLQAVLLTEDDIETYFGTGKGAESYKTPTNTTNWWIAGGSCVDTTGAIVKNYSNSLPLRPVYYINSNVLDAALDGGLGSDD